MPLTLLGILLAACVPPPPAAPQPPPPTAPTTPHESGPSDEVLQARTALGEPAIQLAEAIVDAARRVDHVRHEVPRGQGQADALAAALTALAAAEAATARIQEAIDATESARLPDVHRAASSLASQARAAAVTIAAELESLEPYPVVDLALADLVAGWSAGGSRSEFVARMQAGVDAASVLLTTARRLPAGPSGCTGLRTNRIRWADLVLRRSRALLELAEAGDGPGYDALVQRFTPAPLGEDPLVADAESRACWVERSALPGLEQVIRARVETLEEALNP